MASPFVLPESAMALGTTALTTCTTTRFALAKPTLGCSASTHLAPSLSVGYCFSSEVLLTADVLPAHAALAMAALFAVAAHTHLGHAGGALLSTLDLATALATTALTPALDESTPTISATCHSSCHPPLAGFSNAARAKLLRRSEVHLVRIDRRPRNIIWLSGIPHVFASYFLRLRLVNERLRA
jgi:hypothetical protein